MRRWVDIYHRARSETDYTPSYYIQMVSEYGGLETARRLINSSTPSEGYERLYLLKRLDLTVEALVNDNREWHPLFTRVELKRARERLQSYRYFSGP